MRIAYLDCFSGISGDMLLGALVNLGVDCELFRHTIHALGLDAQVEVRTVDRNGISAVKIDVRTPGMAEDDVHVVLAGHSHDHGNALSHQHEHPHSHGHDHHHDGHHHEHDHDHSHHSHVHGRSLSEIIALITQAKIEPVARDLSLRAFRMLGEAESKIHNISLQEIHFHEVGAVDAIVDIVCAAVGAVALGVDRWMCSPVNVGGGTVKCAHGIMPVPAPATAELLKGAPTYSSGLQMELVTPTGAALLRALNVEFGPMPQIAVNAIGYGAGARDPHGHANVLRISVGETADKGATEEVSVLETAVDDLTPEVIGYVIEKALACGALDVMAAPVQMKKNRPGHLITVLCKPEASSAMAQLLLRETSSLGVRIRCDRRYVLDRRIGTVTTSWGDVRVKLGFWQGEIVNCAPEFEDCRRIAQEHEVPLKLVLQEAMRAAANIDLPQPAKRAE